MSHYRAHVESSVCCDCIHPCQCMEHCTGKAGIAVVELPPSMGSQRWDTQTLGVPPRGVAHGASEASHAMHSNG
eukprot:8387789-Karenia_brevis.AAC.1